MSGVRMAAPAVTVALTAYSPKYISEAIDSVLVQTFQDFETVVVNDGSPETDALEHALAPYQSRIRYIRQQNGGVSAARNTAVQAASAPLIVNLDHDDILEPEHLATQVSFMREHPHIDVSYVNLTFFGGGPLDGTLWMDHYPSDGEVSLRSVLAGRTCPSNPGSIIRRDTLLRVGPYDPNLNSWEDFDMWLRILAAGGTIAYNRDPLVRYRIHGNNLTSRRLCYMENAVRVLDKAEANLRLTPEEATALAARRKIAVCHLELLRGKEALRRREWPAARRHFEYCESQSPTPKLRAVLLALHWFPWLLSAAMSLRRRASLLE
jgi:glycosyltransferase involved in cell wall biosynthesis